MIRYPKAFGISCVTCTILFLLTGNNPVYGIIMGLICYRIYSKAKIKQETNAIIHKQYEEMKNKDKRQ